jgi:hypothetical protein
VAFEHKHPALVAGDQIVCPSGFREGQEKIVGVIRRPPDERYPVDILGKFSYFIDQPPAPWGLMRSAIAGFRRVARNSSRCSAQVRSVKRPSCQAR